MSDTSYLNEWLVCPECGHDEFLWRRVPYPSDDTPSLKCPECGLKGVLSDE